MEKQREYSAQEIRKARDFVMQNATEVPQEERDAFKKDYDAHLVIHNRYSRETAGSNANFLKSVPEERKMTAVIYRRQIAHMLCNRPEENYDRYEKLMQEKNIPSIPYETFVESYAGYLKKLQTSPLTTYEGFFVEYSGYWNFIANLKQKPITAEKFFEIWSPIPQANNLSIQYRRHRPPHGYMSRTETTYKEKTSPSFNWEHIQSQGIRVGSKVSSSYWNSVNRFYGLDKFIKQKAAYDKKYGGKFMDDHSSRSGKYASRPKRYPAYIREPKQLTWEYTVVKIGPSCELILQDENGKIQKAYDAVEYFLIP